MLEDSPLIWNVILMLPVALVMFPREHQKECSSGLHTELPQASQHPCILSYNDWESVQILEKSSVCVHSKIGSSAHPTPS